MDLQTLKNPQVIRLLPLLFLLFFSMLIASGLFSHEPKSVVEKSHLVGTNLVRFDVPVIGDAKQHLGPSLWANQVVVLNIFASWCIPCAQEQPALMHLAQSGKVAVYGIAWKDDAKKTVAWLTQYGNPFQVVGIDTIGRVTYPLALTGIPETFVISRDGKIAYDNKAPLTNEIVDNEILPLVANLQNNVPAR